MDISIIVPTFKPGKYIYECLSSIVHQTFDKNKFELVVVLNGTKEPYFTDIDKYLQDKGIYYKLLYCSLSSVSHARNEGIKNANGNYISFIDDDDYVSECYLEELYEKASKNTVSIAKPIAFDDITGEIWNTYPITKEYLCCKGRGKQRFYKPKKFFSGPCMKLIHRDIIGLRMFDIKFKNGEDSLFMFLISDKIKFVDFASERAIYYRRVRHNSAMYTAKKKSYVIKNCLFLIKEYICIYCSNIMNYNFYFFITRILGAFKTMIRLSYLKRFFMIYNIVLNCFILS